MGSISQGVKYMLIATFSFALMNVSVKWLSHLPAHEIILFRSFISLIICVVMIKRKKLSFFGNSKFYLFMRGLTGTIALLLYFITLQNIPIATAVTLQYLSPIFTAIMAIFLLGEKLRPVQWLFFLVSFLGVTMIKGFDERVALMYLVFGLLAAIFSGFAYTFIRKVKDTDDPVVAVFYFPIVSLPIMIVWCCFDWITPQGWEWLILVMVGVFTQLGQYFMAKALVVENAAKVVSMKYIGTIYALSFGYFIFGEKYTWLSFLGILFVASGILLNIFYKQRNTA